MAPHLIINFVYLILRNSINKLTEIDPFYFNYSHFFVNIKKAHNRTINVFQPF